MRTEKRVRTLMSRRRFIQTGATVAAGYVAAACAGNPPPEQAIPVEAAVQNTPTNMPLPPTATTAPTATPLPQPTATDPATGEPPTPEPSPIPTDTVMIDQEQVLIAEMTQAAIAFWKSLDPDQRSQAGYAFTSEERFRWHWTTPGNFPRNGLPLRLMSEDQKTRAHDLLQASLSSMGYEKSLNIISLQNDLGNDPELYFITLFGTPGGAEPWGWRWEGHHLSRQFSVIGDTVAVTPFFLGSWPTTTEAGLRAMTVEEDAALELINSFSADAQAAVIFQDRPITQHITQNAARVGPLEPVGMLYTEMSGTQQQLVTNIMQAYIGTLPDHIATTTTDRIDAAGLDQIRFGWAGSLERERPQYYRLQGPTFLLEYDNTRNGGTHIHSVWRDFERDFGYHLL